MFKFDLNTNESLGDKSVQGNSLSKAIATFIEQEHKTCWLQIQGDVKTNASETKSSTKNTSYFQDYPGHLRQENIAIIRNYDDKGVQNTDLVLGTLKGLVSILMSFQHKKYNEFMSKIHLALPSGVLPHFAAVFKWVVEAKSGGSNTRKILSDEVLILIQLYCKTMGPLVIDVGDVDDFSREQRKFLVNLATEVPAKLCIVFTIAAKEESSTLETTILYSNIHRIIKSIIKKLIRVHLNLTRENEKILTMFILPNFPISNIVQAREIIQNIFEVWSENFSNSPFADGKLNDFNPNLIKQDYFLLSKLNTITSTSSTSSATSTEEKPAEKRVYLLSVILGPYIKLDHLKKLYAYCFEGDGYPDDIDYSKISLVYSDGLIRFSDLGGYDLALAQQKESKATLLVKSVKKRLHNAILEGVMRGHLDALYQSRKTFSNIIEMRIQKAIIVLYGFNIDKNAYVEEHGLSSSSERVLEKTFLLNQQKFNYTAKDLELIINCFNELICYYSAKQDLTSAFNCCRIIAEFLDGFHNDNYKNDMSDIDLVGIFALKRNLTKKDKPYGKLDASLYDPLISILSNLCMVSYFLSKYLSMRKYIGYAYLLQNDNSEHKPVIEACIALVLTQSAESQLRSCIDAELDCPISNPILPNQDWELYHNMRASVSELVLKAQTTLLANPFLPEQALAWSMFVISGNFTMSYELNSKHLRNAYKTGLEQGVYFKAILAFGNSILLEFCSGVATATLKKSCQKFLIQCDNFGIILPKSIIQGFLDYANYSENPNNTNINLEFSTEASNHFFINFTRLLILFAKGDYATCVIFSERMRQAEWQGGKDSSRDGYCIWRIFEWLEAVALLRYLEGNPTQQTKARINVLRYAEKAFKTFAEEFPENFECWYDFLIAEISRSELSQQVIQRHRLSREAQLHRYNQALDSAVRRGNNDCVTEICKTIKEIQSHPDLSVRSSMLPPPRDELRRVTFIENNHNIKKTYDELVQELVNRTGSNIVVLFIYNSKNKKTLPKLAFCRIGKMDEAISAFTGEIFSIDRLPEIVFWHHPAIQQAIKTKKVIYYSAERCAITPFLEVQGVHNMMAIPILHEGQIAAILYFEGHKNLCELDELKLKKFSDFASIFFQAVNSNTHVLTNVRTDNKGDVANQGGASSNKMTNINTSMNANNTMKTSTRTFTVNGFSSLFQKSHSKTFASSSNMATTSSDDNLDISDNQPAV